MNEVTFCSLISCNKAANNKRGKFHHLLDTSQSILYLLIHYLNNSYKNIMYQKLPQTTLSSKQSSG